MSQPLFECPFFLLNKTVKCNFSPFGCWRCHKLPIKHYSRLVCTKVRSQSCLQMIFSFTCWSWNATLFYFNIYYIFSLSKNSTMEMSVISICPTIPSKTRWLNNSLPDWRAICCEFLLSGVRWLLILFLALPSASFPLWTRNITFL